MSNKIKVRRGSDADRKNATTIQDYEIHYSTANSDGAGRPERLWVADSNAAAGNSQDLLVGPFEFVSGDARITVNTDYQTGRVTIGYLDAATWNPSQSVTRVASTYSNNSTIEAGDSFGGPHTLTVTTGSGANEIRIDRAGYTFNNAFAYFASPLDAIDGNVLASGSANLSWSQNIATPAGFSIANLDTRRVKVRVFADPPAGSGFSQDGSDHYFGFGWRLRGFVSTQAFSSATLPTVSQITSTSGSNLSRFNSIVQTPTTATQYNYALPNDGQKWFPYLVHTCAPDPSGDLYGWEPSVSVVGSGPIGISEVTQLTSAEVVVVGASGQNLGGQSVAKAYRVWRIGSSDGYTGNGSTLQFIIS